MSASVSRPSTAARTTSSCPGRKASKPKRSRSGEARSVRRASIGAASGDARLSLGESFRSSETSVRPSARGTRGLRRSWAMASPSCLSPRRQSSSARGVVKRYGQHGCARGPRRRDRSRASPVCSARTAPARRRSSRWLLGLRSRDDGELTVLGRDPATAGIEVRARIGYAPEHHDLPAELAASGLRAAPRRDAPAPATRGGPASERRAVARGSRRGALPAGRDDVDGPAAAGQARVGDRARSRARPPRRADGRARPDATRRRCSTSSVASAPSSACTSSCRPTTSRRSSGSATRS